MCNKQQTFTDQFSKDVEIFERMYLDDEREIKNLAYPTLDADRIFADLKAQTSR